MAGPKAAQRKSRSGDKAVDTAADPDVAKVLSGLSGLDKGNEAV